eukprot:5291005-Amphidinium_carterae.1
MAIKLACVFVRGGTRVKSSPVNLEIAPSETPWDCAMHECRCPGVMQVDPPATDGATSVVAHAQ